MKKLMKSKTAGITLIALVVTIIVLLILAGVSVQMLSGNNGILTRAGDAGKESVHANVYEQLQLKIANYIIEKNLGNVEESGLLEYLQAEGREIIGAELGENGSGKYQINIEKLLGTAQKYGKGTASGSDVRYTDGKIYKIICYEDESNSRPIAIAVVESKPFKMKIKSGNDGGFVLPISPYENIISIDWGDGTTLGKKDTKHIKLASRDMNNLKIASGVSGGCSHTYSESNKEYIVTVYGLTQIGNCGYDKENVIEIIQWGDTRLTYINLNGCTNLSKIANPDEDSFKNLEYINLHDTAWYDAQPDGPVYLGSYYYDNKGAQ